MNFHRIGILHPGEMGISVAVSAQRGGQTVYWASAGRSLATRLRAEKFGLVDTHKIGELCGRCSLLISVCPPQAALAVAQQVIAAGYRGLYLDANAISPQLALQIESALSEAGIDFVDGGIIGGPAWEPGSTWLYLSGPRAGEIAECFTAGPLEAIVLGAETGAASALKMCYAGYTKGSTALLCAILAAAESLGVRQALFTQWEREESGSSSQASQRAQRVTTKAWRFEAEMDEIAATFEASGVPPGFHQAAAEIYHRLADFKGLASLPALEQVLDALLGRNVAPPS